MANPSIRQSNTMPINPGPPSINRFLSSCVNPAGATSSTSPSGDGSMTTSSTTAVESIITESTCSMAANSVGSCAEFVFAHNIGCAIRTHKNSKNVNRFMIE